MYSAARTPIDPPLYVSPCPSANERASAEYWYSSGETCGSGCRLPRMM